MDITWQDIENIDSTILAKYLSREYPQTVAAVLSQLENKFAANILQKFEPAFIFEVINRLRVIVPVCKPCLDSVKQTIYQELVVGRADYYLIPEDKHTEIFNSMSQKDREEFLNYVRNVDTGKLKNFLGEKCD